MSSINSRLYLQVSEAMQANRALPTGTIEVRFTSGYRKLMRTLNGSLALRESLINPSTSLFVLQVPPQVLLRPAWHQVYLHAALSPGLNDVIGPQSRDIVAKRIVSFALHQLAAGAPRGFLGYSIVAELGMFHEEVVDERIHARALLLAEMELTEDYNLYWDGSDQDPAPKDASRNAIDKLIEKGSFVASKSDQELGTCGICLEEFSSSVGAELLRMDCSHIYHQACMLPWLDKSSTCPTCRRQVH